MAKTHSKEFVSLAEAARQQVTEISVDEVLARRQGGEAFHLVDVREDHEWNAGHATGAEHLGRGILERDIVQHIPDKEAPIILYCGGGFRSALAAESLQKMGYRKVRSMAGGYSEWQTRGGPTTIPNRD